MGVLGVLWSSFGESEPLPSVSSKNFGREMSSKMVRESVWARFRTDFGARGREKVWFFFLGKTGLFGKSTFRPKRDLSSFLRPFWPLGTACGSLLAPDWVSLGALGPPEFALETSPGRAGTPPGAFLDAQSRCWSVFGHLKRSQGSWKAHF